MTRGVGLPRLGPFVIWTFCLFVFLSASTATWGSNGMKQPIAALINGAAVCGCLALIVTGIATVASRRRVVAVDLFRIACWVIIGACVGLKLAVPTFQYFFHINGYYPAYIAPLRYSTTGAMIVALIAIPASMLLYPLPRTPDSNHCARCGYNLTGNVTGVCPECGTTTDSGRYEDSNRRKRRSRRGAETRA